MILGLGIDSVEISRFQDWQNYSQKQLLRFFSEAEIAYCLTEPRKSAERFAARFAAKEAFLKAISQMCPEKRFSLLKVAKSCQISKDHAFPVLFVNWKALNITEFKVLVSLTHTRQTASAAVILQEE